MTETVTGLAPDDLHGEDGTNADADAASAAHDDRSAPADAVRAAILDLVLALNTLLPAAAGHARDAGDRRACVDGTRLAYELGCCWEGRLRTFLNS